MWRRLGPPLALVSENTHNYGLHDSIILIISRYIGTKRRPCSSQLHEREVILEGGPHPLDYLQNGPIIQL